MAPLALLPALVLRVDVGPGMALQGHSGALVARGGVLHGCPVPTTNHSLTLVVVSAWNY